MRQAMERGGVKPLRITACCAILTALGAAPLPAAEAPWESQLREMGYWIVHLSNINVVNGLNLSREQAESLRAMAQRVEQASPPAPVAKAPFNSPLDLTRSAYAETREVLLRGEPVSEDLRRRVAAAREQEAKVIRASLCAAANPGTGSSCLACHGQPDWSRINGPLEPPAVFQRPDMKIKSSLAHSLPILGLRGLREVRRAAPQVDGRLNDWQQMTLGKFSCCLIPPRDLAEPARVGQAPVDEKTVELLDHARDVSDWQWPWVRQWATALMMEGEKMRRPSLAGEAEEALRQEVASALDEARQLPDLEFAVEKESLAKRMKSQPAEPKKESDRRFKTAYFLLLPGSVQAYDALLKRINSAQPAAPSVAPAAPKS